jgi:hypothetical protein
MRSSTREGARTAARIAGLLLLTAGPLVAQQPVLVTTPRARSLDDALELAIPASDGVGLARADVKRAEGEVKRGEECHPADRLRQMGGGRAWRCARR